MNVGLEVVWEDFNGGFRPVGLPTIAVFPSDDPQRCTIIVFPFGLITTDVDLETSKRWAVSGQLPWGERDWKTSHLPLSTIMKQRLGA